MTTRRECLALAAVAGALSALPPRLFAADEHGPLLTRPIPSTGEQLPIIGLGSSSTFSEAAGQNDTDTVRSVLAKMLELGGRVFDTAPGYGASEQLAGKIVKEIDTKHQIFWATKLNVAGWGGSTADPKAARAQVAASFERLGRDKIDLIQVHNVADLATQFPILREFKEQGRVRYVGTTSTFKPQYDVLERFMRTEPCDFIGIDYSVDNTSAEERILPLAQERKIAVLGYMPTGRKRLFERVEGQEVPDWAHEFGAQTWGQFFLKFAASHPAMTVVTPATSKPEHMIDNMAAARGRLPTETERKRMVELVAKLPA